MFAVVDIKGFQEKVTEGQKLRVPRISEETGAKLVFDQVLLLSKDSAVTVGTPNIAGVTVEAKVLAHTRGDKIRVVKQRRRKRYRRVKGHRTEYTEIEIVKIKA
ncbi:50S ribosomal protein L21 [Candidatus Peribacteria bacterium RIFCSPHIGHO2_02_FULL_53_20]|nr:MAG: 50S ribosomal protein L21 [Candidatus Peribacteria bacterium RIFCSPHIGHO2_02_FULL_53_20]OGJ66969.1 MAG: 50S ribosomal protein L21 [Candidatus Peribacteria bacterium RIFCSPLOWO2_01_FULL_53_10]OGJ72810.1 MAG: 50S ribosomal protein L21 [Candidatus Peribacteria bacterium RIFCSPLOWO2_12_FULL_53_10]